MSPIGQTSQKRTMVEAIVSALGNTNVLTAAGRHVVSYVMGAVSFGAAIGYIDPTQVDTLKHALETLVGGITTTAGALATIISLVSGIWAGMSATPISQAKALIAQVPETKIVTSKVVADSIPLNAVQSTQDAEVVQK